jgi:hypothetical protein
MRALVPSRVYCEQLRVKSRRLMEFITPFIMAKVRDTFFIYTVGGVLYNFWTILTLLAFFTIILLTILRVGVLGF